MCVCLYQRISLTAEPIWSPYSEAFKDPGKVYNYFGQWDHHPPKTIAPKRMIPTKIFDTCIIYDSDVFDNMILLRR